MEEVLSERRQQQEIVTYNFPTNNDNPIVIALSKERENENDVVVSKVYRRRWIMLAIFILVSMSNAFLWLQYSIVTDIMMK